MNCVVLIITVISIVAIFITTIYALITISGIASKFEDDFEKIEDDRICQK